MTHIERAMLPKTAFAVLSAGSLLLTSQVIGVPTAKAALGDADCNGGELCVWKDDGFSGCLQDFASGSSDGDYTNGGPNWNSPCSGSINDQVSSYWNRSKEWVIFYLDSGYEPSSAGAPYNARFCAEPGASSGDLNNFGPPSPEDRWSSHTSVGAAPPPAITCTMIDEN